MKPKHGHRSFSCLAFLIVVLATVATPSPVYGKPDSGFRFSASSFNSISILTELQPGLQPGFMIGAVLDLASSDVFSMTVDSGGQRPALLLDLGFQAFWLGDSTPARDGNLYRAWRGFSTLALMGVRFPVFPLGFINASGALHALGGVNLMSTKYTGTGLLSASPALAFRLGMDTSFGGNLRYGLELPVEIAFKSGGIAVVFGLSGVVVLDQWKKKP